MIEVAGLDRRATLAGAGACLSSIMEAEAEQLGLAAHWADLHDPAGLPAPETVSEVRRRRFDGDYGVRPGGEGTPEVLARCFLELGVVLQASAGGAEFLVGDALDLWHRLPGLWGEVRAGRVRGWKARKVAQATRHLPRSVVGEVDAGLAGLLSSLPWSRCALVLAASVMRGDAAGAAYGEAEAGSRRFVGLGRDGGAGLKTLIARGEVLDILTFLAAVNRIAEVLGLEGDLDSVEVRRSKAVGILGEPDRALALLARHQGDEDVPPAAVAPCAPGGWRRGHDGDGELDAPAGDGLADGGERRCGDPVDDPDRGGWRAEPRAQDDSDEEPDNRGRAGAWWARSALDRPDWAGPGREGWGGAGPGPAVCASDRCRVEWDGSGRGVSGGGCRAGHGGHGPGLAATVGCEGDGASGGGAGAGGPGGRLRDSPRGSGGGVVAEPGECVSVVVGHGP